MWLIRRQYAEGYGSYLRTPSIRGRFLYVWIPNWLGNALWWLWLSLPVFGQAWGSELVEGGYFWLWFGARYNSMNAHMDMKRMLEGYGMKRQPLNYGFGWSPPIWRVSWYSHEASFHDELHLAELGGDTYWRSRGLR